MCNTLAKRFLWKVVAPLIAGVVGFLIAREILIWAGYVVLLMP